MSDRLKPSRMELRLEAEIAGAATAIDADCKRAELAGYHARLGRFDEAKSTIAALHHRYDSRPNVAISSWVNLVEGLIGHFSDMDPAARDKVLRAHALSTAAGLTSMRALSAAWLAHLDYLQANVPLMVAWVKEVLAIASPHGDSAYSRVSLVVAQAYHVASGLDSAIPWYSRAREWAGVQGDDATISALMHNMAWLRAHELRRLAFSEQDIDQAKRHALLSVESTGNFDFLIGSSSLQSLIPILRAQVLSVLGREAEALVLYERHLASALKEGMGRLQADLMADIAWCQLILGQTDRAAESAVAAEASIDPVGHHDDRALAHSRLAQVFRSLGQSAGATRHQALADTAWAGHASLRKRILGGLGDLTVQPPVPPAV